MLIGWPFSIVPLTSLSDSTPSETTDACRADVIFSCKVRSPSVFVSESSCTAGAGKDSTGAAAVRIGSQRKELRQALCFCLLRKELRRPRIRLSISAGPNGLFVIRVESVEEVV